MKINGRANSKTNRTSQIYLSVCIYLVAISKIQFAPCAKIQKKFLGPYTVRKKIGIDRYKVQKTGNDVGPKKTQSAADLIKPWSSGADDLEEGRVVGNEMTLLCLAGGVPPRESTGESQRGKLLRKAQRVQHCV